MEENAYSLTHRVMEIIQLRIQEKRLREQLEKETSGRDAAAAKRYELEAKYVEMKANAEALASTVVEIEKQENAFGVMLEKHRDKYNKLVDVIKGTDAVQRRFLEPKRDIDNRINCVKKARKAQTQEKSDLKSELMKAIKQAAELEEALDLSEGYEQCTSNRLTANLCDDDAKIMAQQQRKANILSLLKAESQRHYQLEKESVEQEQNVNQFKAKLAMAEADHKSLSPYPELLRNQKKIKTKLETEIAALREQLADHQPDSQSVPPKKTFHNTRNTTPKFTAAKESPMRTSSGTTPKRTASEAASNSKQSSTAAASRTHDGANDFIHEFLFY